MTVITEDYAELSLLCGMFCGKADNYLGRSHFAPMARRKAWDLTPELLAEWHQEALAMGIPEAVILLTPEEQQAFPAQLRFAIAMHDEFGAPLLSDAPPRPPDAA